MTSLDRFDHPLTGRYASDEMQRLFSTGNRYTTWRRLWLALAAAESELGLEIPSEALEQMLTHLDLTTDDLERVREYEKQTRHDVMAHLQAFADRAPAAKPILHLGATSAYVGDNADLIITRDALDLVMTRVLAVVGALAEFAEKWADEPTLGMTHFQPAQPTTVGKRACLWLHELLLDLDRLRFERGRLQLRGAKGTTGTQASFLELFDGDHLKVRKLDDLVAARLGFDRSYPVTGQTYSRKIDAFLLDGLSGVAQSAARRRLASTWTRATDMPATGVSSSSTTRPTSPPSSPAHEPATSSVISSAGATTVRSATASLVCSPRTTSTSRISGTGLK